MRIAVFLVVVVLFSFLFTTGSGYKFRLYSMGHTEPVEIGAARRRDNLRYGFGLSSYENSDGANSTSGPHFTIRLRSIMIQNKTISPGRLSSVYLSLPSTMSYITPSFYRPFLSEIQKHLMLRKIYAVRKQNLTCVSSKSRLRFFPQIIFNFANGAEIKLSPYIYMKRAVMEGREWFCLDFSEAHDSDVEIIVSESHERDVTILGGTVLRGRRTNRHRDQVGWTDPYNGSPKEFDTGGLTVAFAVIMLACSVVVFVIFRTRNRRLGLGRREFGR